MDMMLDQKRSFNLSEVFTEAWQRVRGNKWAIWAIALPLGLIAIIVQYLIGRIFHMDAQGSSTFYRYLLMPLINAVVVAPFYAGAFMTAILCARGQPIGPKTGFQYFSKSVPVIITMLIIAFAANIITYIAHLPALGNAMNFHTGWLNLIAILITIVVYLFTLFSVPLVVDKNLSPVPAIKTSFQIIKHCWLKTLALLIIMYVFFIVAMIPFYVGAMIHPIAKIIGGLITIGILIWLVPFIFLLQGVLYHKLVD